MIIIVYFLFTFMFFYCDNMIVFTFKLKQPDIASDTDCQLFFYADLSTKQISHNMWMVTILISH